MSGLSERGGRGRRPGPRGQRDPVNAHHGAVAGLGRGIGSRGGVRDRPRRGQVEVRDQQRLLELRSPGDQAALGVDDDRIPVEDQLVLAAHQVDVGQRRARLAGPADAQLQPGLVLAPLVRGGVRDHQQPRAGLPGHRDRAAVLPQVLADGDGHVHRVPAAVGYRDADHRQPVPGHEIAVLVEHPVVRQVMLGRGDRDRPAVQQRRRVLGRADRFAGPGRPARPPAQVAGDDGDVAQPGLGPAAAPSPPGSPSRRPRTSRAAPDPPPGSRSASSRETRRGRRRRPRRGGSTPPPSRRSPPGRRRSSSPGQGRSAAWSPCHSNRAAAGAPRGRFRPGRRPARACSR